MQSVVLVLRHASKHYRRREFHRSHTGPNCVAEWMITRRITKATSLFIADRGTHAKGKLAADTGCVSVMEPGICLNGPVWRPQLFYHRAQWCLCAAESSWQSRKARLSLWPRLQIIFPRPKGTCFISEQQKNIGCILGVLPCEKE